MLEDAINQILEIINSYPNIYKFAIEDKDKYNITIYYSDTEFYEKRFTNAVDLFEWSEQNLQTRK